LYVEDTGTGQPVVLLHSSGLSGRQWRSLSSELVRGGRRAVIPDLSGHGQSDPWPEPEPFSFRTDVEKVAAIVRSLERAHVVGHSYGGLIALHTALAEPRAIASLHLFDPVAFGVLDPTLDRDARAVLEALDLSWGPSAADRERWLRSFVDFWGGGGSWDALREPVRAEFRRVAWVVREGVASLTTDATPLSAYRELRLPVHLMTGERSPLPARRVTDRLVEGLPGARLDVVPGAGHLAPVTEAATVARLIIEALEAPG